MTNLTRRSALKGGAGLMGAGALAGSGFGDFAKAWAQTAPWKPEAGATLNLMRWRRFVVAEDEAFNKIVAAFTAATGVRVAVTSESFDDMQPKASVAANTGTGPDIFWSLYSTPHLFPQRCLDVTDVADYLGKKYGGWVPVAEAYGKLGNKWIGIPAAINGGYINYRNSMIKAAGFNEVPQTTAGFLELCKALKAKGTPAGFPLGRASGDGNAWVHWCLWAFGGNVVDAKDKVVLNSPETAKALEYAQALYANFIPGTLSSLVWSANNDVLLYGLANEHWRTDNVWMHRLGTKTSEDVQIFKEKDIGFGVGIGKTAADDYIVIATGDNETSEVYLLPADEPGATPMLVSARKKGREYSVDVRGKTLFIHTNDDHANFRIATASLDTPGEWTTLIPGSDDVYITDLAIFRDYFVLETRKGGLDQIDLRQYATPTNAGPLAFPETNYVASLGDNPEYHQDKLRIDYESMITPDTVFDYDVKTGKLATLKVQEIPSGYDATKYETELVNIKARDGTMVPVSLMYKKGLKRDGLAPMHLYVYGSYGYRVPPGFSTTRLSLVDRGMVYAIAHVRGGDDLGRNWYLQGKLFERKNSFNDFIDIARGLIANGYTSAGKISIEGRSAGGQVMGVVYNEAPELWGAVLAGVPFVDVINTMTDESLPLTPGEWPEWGNPITDKAAFDYMRSYDPYLNVTAQAYPPMLVSAGLNDPRVTYWEPAKWVAKLRSKRTNDAMLLLRTNMGAGHGGKSGRWGALREDAEEFAFVLTQLGVEK
ncbi:MAG: extracellular solute-binding protein [Sphingopyxis sp.]|nr:extracellular solute-binding protein [Sphingopyxis sp.]